MAQLVKHKDEAVLELRDEAPSRPFMILGDERYHFSLRSDLSLKEITRSIAIGERLQELDQAFFVGMKRLDQWRLRKDLRTCVAMVMHDMPKRVIRKLSDMECAEVISAFSRALPDKQTKPTAQQPISSRASSGSTKSRRKK